MNDYWPLHWFRGSPDDPKAQARRQAREGLARFRRGYARAERNRRNRLARQARRRNR